MKRQTATRETPTGSGLAFPVALLGSLFLIALALYAVDVAGLQMLLASP